VANKSIFGNRWQPLFPALLQIFCKIFVGIGGNRAVISLFNWQARGASARRGCLMPSPSRNSGVVAARVKSTHSWSNALLSEIVADNPHLPDQATAPRKSPPCTQPKADVPTKCEV